VPRTTVRCQYSGPGSASRRSPQFTAVDGAFDDDGGSAKLNSPTPSISGSAMVVL
jgi:hypothetical protein